jgi:CheY-like chemotaxis protein
MPEMDGPQVAIALRSLFKANSLVTGENAPYICCCSAYDEAGFKKQALSAGMNEFLTKPVTYSEL